jgi:hypothetical protein
MEQYNYGSVFEEEQAKMRQVQEIQFKIMDFSMQVAKLTKQLETSFFREEKLKTRIGKLNAAIFELRERKDRLLFPEFFAALVTEYEIYRLCSIFRTKVK